MKLTKQMRKDIEAWLALADDNACGTCPFGVAEGFMGIYKCDICKNAFGRIGCPCKHFGVAHVRKVAKKALKTGEL